MDESSNAGLPFHGEESCFGKTANGGACRNKAYYLDRIKPGRFFCGVHTRSRVSLPIDPNFKAKRQARQEDIVNSALMVLALDGPKEKGNIVLYKMKMMKDVEVVPGFLPVFPNYRHGGRKDGIGVPALSPKSLGPIPSIGGLPPALNLENWWQGSKVYPNQADGEGNPTESFFVTRNSMYNDPIPHRYHPESGKKNAPLYWLYVDEDGKEYRFKYVESRQFYCQLYEQLVPKTEDFKRLVSLLNDGVNLQICGYDAYSIDGLNLRDCFLDGSRPFGHELVLYSLLTNQPVWREFVTVEIDMSN